MDTMKLTETQAELVAAIRECVTAERALNAANRVGLDIERPNEYSELEARADVASDAIKQLADQLPTPARSKTDVILRAQVAYALASKDRNGRIEASDDEAEESARQLIEAVHEFAGISYS
jgi:hypothetical protein